MGNLKPGVKYIYERNGNTTYAREFGADPSTRQAIGWDYDPEEAKRFDGRKIDSRTLIDEIRDDQMWGQIRREAKTNITLQKALDRAIMIYKLSKERYE